MLRYLAKRFAWAITMVLAVTVVTFVIFRIVPSNPAVLYAGPSATPADIKRTERYLGVDRPVYVQYGKFVWNLVWHHSLGRSFRSRQNVNDIVAAAVPVTAAVMAGGLLLMLLISLPIGLLCALRPRSVAARLATVYVFIGASIPHLWLALLLSYLIGFKLGWTPIVGYCDAINPATQCGGVAQWADHLILPWLTIGGLGGALYVRMVRANVLETLDAEYVRTARAKGASEWRVILSHVMRNAMLPLITILGLDVGLLFGGAVFVETIFALPGLGKLAVDSIDSRDLPVTEGIVVFTTSAIIVANLCTDLLYSWIDPRIRIE